MGSISNGFITITYNNESQEKIAKFYMLVFNYEPLFFKGLLNGLDKIKGHQLRKLKIDENKIIQNYKKNRYSIIYSILKLTSAKHPFFETGGYSQSNIYYDILRFKSGSEKDKVRLEIEYFDLAYDYFRMTGDFKYLKKYLYEEEIDKQAIKDLCDNKILNCLPQLLKTKINEEKYSFQSISYKYLKDNINDILSIVPIVNRMSINALYKINEEKKQNISSKPVPKIDDKQFDELVIGSLNYIDPTNKLVEKYLELKKKEKIIKKLDTSNKQSSYHSNDDIIKLYKIDNLTDIIIFVHEFSHYNYRNKEGIFEHNELLSEYPSIYYEMKTQEYLKKIGYTTEEINNANSFRAINNNNIINHITPNLIALNIAISEVDVYSAIEKIITYIDKEVKECIESIPEEVKKDREEELQNEIRTAISCMVLEDSIEIMEEVKYIIGIFLADFSIRNVEHEDVLRVLEQINTTSMSIEEAYKMLNNEVKGYQKVKRENLKK